MVHRHIRCCKRCNEDYITFGKYSKYCPKCIKTYNINRNVVRLI